jgi:pilus assembly protein CpaE
VARIYVIDDDAQLLRMVGLMLERGGHAVTLLNNPIDGLEQIRADKPELLVLDVMMPNMSGHDLAKEIRSDKALADLPILMLTARSQEIDRMTALQSGASDYLSKPVTSQELIERVSLLLSAAGEEPAQADSEQGFIITVYSLRGGAGRTTLAVNLAAALRKISQDDVCLVDLSPSGGQAVMHMRLQPRASWLDLPDSDRLNWESLKEQLTVHPSGLKVLAAPVKPQAPNVLSAERTAHILEILRAHMSFTVIDTPSALTQSFFTAVSMADMAVHIVNPEVVSVQTAVKLNHALAKQNIQINRNTHISNQLTPEPQLNPTAVERGLNAKLAFHIGFDANQSRAMTQGVPLALTPAKTPLPTVSAKMAEVIWKRIKKS